MTQPKADAVAQLMEVVRLGFEKTAEALRDIQEQQTRLEARQQQQARATYDACTASGKSRYVTSLVESESEVDARGAVGRVAADLDISTSRVYQLLSSEKNRRNGK